MRALFNRCLYHLLPTHLISVLRRQLLYHRCCQLATCLLLSRTVLVAATAIAAAGSSSSWRTTATGCSNRHRPQRLLAAVRSTDRLKPRPNRKPTGRSSARSSCCSQLRLGLQLHCHRPDIQCRLAAADDPASATGTATPHLHSQFNRALSPAAAADRASSWLFGPSCVLSDGRRHGGGYGVGCYGGYCCCDRLHHSNRIADAADAYFRADSRMRHR